MPEQQSTDVTSVSHTLTRIPEELQALQQWVPFIVTDKGVKKPAEGYAVDKPAGWLAFPQIVELCANNNCLAAFALTKRDPYTVVDLDYPKDSKLDTDNILADHARLLEIMSDTYTEQSVSGKGYHIWLKGEIDKGVKNAKACVEIYDEWRFIICTGVSNNQPILEDQETVTGLYEKFKTRQSKNADFQNHPQEHTDKELVEKCKQRFPERFEILYGTPVDPGSTTKSEDDHALIAMLCEFSDNLDQIHRLFLNSSRVRRKHIIHPHNYITRSAAKTQSYRYKQINTAALLSNMKNTAAVQVTSEEEKVLLENLPYDPGIPTPPPPAPNIFEKHYPQPLGLLDEITKFSMESAPYPDPDISLAGAIGFLAGVIGRRYTFNSSALNVYIAVLAPSSHGKSAAANTCDKLSAELVNPVAPDGTYQEHLPDAGNFFQRQIRSAPALYKNVLPKQQSFTWLVDELGKVEQVQKTRGNATGTEIQAALLELYSAHIAGGHVVSDKNNEPVPQVLYPAMSVLGNSVESVFFESLDEDSFTGGMFGRYFFLAIRRDKPYEQFNRVDRVSHSFRQKLVVLARQGLESVGDGRSLSPEGVLQLQATERATELLRTFSRDCVDNYNRWQLHNSIEGPTGALWGRLSHKVTKLAGLHAVSRYAGDDRLLLDTTIPLVDEIDVRWGITFVEHEMAVLKTIATEGHFGGDEDKRKASLLKALKEDFYDKPPHQWSAGVKKRALKIFQENRAIPKSALYFLVKSKAGWTAKALERSRFRNTREVLGATLQELVDSGEIYTAKVGNAEYFWLPEYYPETP